MKSLVAYASKHGCTEKCARLLAEKLPGDVTLVNLEKEIAPSPEAFDTVLVGGSIYVGKVQKAVTDYCTRHQDLLIQKKVGLFLCCSNEPQLELQMRGAFPEPVFSHAAAREHFGFAYPFERMNFMERTAIKLIAKTNKSTETILHPNIERFVAALA